MWDVVKKYKSKDTSFKQRTENITEYPTLAIIPRSRSLPKAPRSYKYNVDFNITINGVTLNVGSEINSMDNDVLKLEEVETAYGTWYKLMRIPTTPKIRQGRCTIRVLFNQSTIQKEDLPIMKFFITSEENSYGFVLFNWMEGEVLTYDAKPETWTDVILKAEKIMSLPSSDKCDHKSAYHCMASFVESYDCKSCSNKCLPQYFIDSLEPFLNGTNEVCKEKHEIKCFTKCLKKIIDELIEDGPCRKSCNILEFIGKTVVEGEDVPEMNLNHATQFSYSIKAPATMVVNEEYLIYDLEGLVGSVGGTLGMFIGFSFINVIKDVLNYLKQLLEKKK